MTYIGTRLKHERKQRGFSQTNLAKIAGITKADLRKCESKRSKELSVVTLFLLAEHLSINPFWLLTGLGTPKQSRLFPDISAKTLKLAYKIDQLSETESSFIHRIVSVMNFESASFRSLNQQTAKKFSLVPKKSRKGNDKRRLVLN